ncbi:MAG: hypothetical protein JXO44_08885 [Clostridia bacterium]|nr:hypothetical protein [Clostridia bacterium]
MLNRILSLVLTMSLLSSICIYSFADQSISDLSVNGDFKIIERILNDDGEVVKEISEYQGNLYYYEKNKDQTIAIDMTRSGQVDIHKKSNSSKNTVIASKTIEATDKVSLKNIQATSKDKVALIQQLRNDVVNGKIQLTEKSYSSSFEMAEIKSTRSVASKIDDALEEEYGAPYSNKLIAGKSKDGVYAKLYESKSFYRTKKTSWIINAGTTIGIAAILLGVPQSTIAWIFYTASTGTGVVSIINDVTGNKYIANVNYNKEVEINDVYPYRAGKTVYSYAYVGDKRAALEYRKTTQNSDFSDNIGLLDIGIRNYLAMQ